MDEEQRIKQRILAMPECDKNGLILQIIHCMYPNELRTGEVTEWSPDTIEWVAEILGSNQLVPVT